MRVKGPPTKSSNRSDHFQITKWLKAHPLFVKAVHGYLQAYYKLATNPQSLQNMQRSVELERERERERGERERKREREREIRELFFCSEGMSDEEDEEAETEAERLMDELQRAAQAAGVAAGGGGGAQPQAPPPISAVSVL